jgi:hypothetical protein
MPFIQLLSGKKVGFQNCGENALRTTNEANLLA